MQYAESEMDLLNQEKARENKKRTTLFAERDEAISMLNDIRQQAQDAKSEFEEQAVLQSVGTVAASLSSIRRRLDGVSNTFVTHHQRASFIEFVLRDDSMSGIIDGMDMIDLQGVIEQNAGLSIQITESEIEAMGSAREFAALKSALRLT